MIRKKIFSLLVCIVATFTLILSFALYVMGSDLAMYVMGSGLAI